MPNYIRLTSLGFTWLSSCVFFFLFFQLDLGIPCFCCAELCNLVQHYYRGSCQTHCQDCQDYQVSDLSFLWSPVKVPTYIRSGLKSLILIGSLHMLHVLKPCLRSFAFLGWPFVLDRQSLPERKGNGMKWTQTAGIGRKKTSLKSSLKKKTSILAYQSYRGWQKMPLNTMGKENTKHDRA